MNINDIVLGNNQVLIPEITREIQEIAIRLNQNENLLYRRDLVNELNEQIPNLSLTDGRIINALVKEAYFQTNSPSIQKAITERFIENSGDRLVYDPYKIGDAELNLCGKIDDTLDLKVFNQKVEVINDAVESVAKNDTVAEINNTKNLIDLLVPENNFSLTGRTKVNDTFNYARKIHEGYENLIDQYELAKQANLDLIKDFEILRDELLNFRAEINQLLINILDEDIKTTHPDLFDFLKIEYFDINHFRGELNLAFEGLAQKMQIFNSEYNDKMLALKEAGTIHADNALDRLSTIKKRRGHVSRREVKGQVAVAALGFAFDAFLSISETRKSAEENVAQLKHDIEVMKLGLKDDSQIIINDLLRLGKLHSRIKGVLIPGLRKFITQANHIYNSTIKDAYTEMVKGGTIGELGSENRKLAAEKKQIILEIEDLNRGIIICENEISKYQGLVSEIEFEYSYVNEIKPCEPIKFHNIISLGTAKTEYEKLLTDWIRITEPVRTRYEAYVNFTKLEEETLLKFHDVQGKLYRRLEEIEKQYDYNKIKIKEQTVKVEDFIPEFDAFTIGIKQLSNASKNFLELGIAENLMNISAHAQSSFDEISISDVNSIPSKTNTDINYLSKQSYMMELKDELLNHTESILSGEMVEIIGELTNENLENFIADKIGKVKSHLTSKIQQKTKLNAEQADRLVIFGTEVLISIIKTHKIKQKTNFLKEINSRLDQEFLQRFEISVTSFKNSVEKDQQEAKNMESALNDAISAQDLLMASELLKNN